MSSRAVKRLLKERGYDELAESNAHIERRERELQGEDQEASDSDESKPQAKANMFDLLMGEDNDGSDSDRSEADVETAPVAKPEVAAAEGKRRAKGKKKGKGKKSGAAAATGSEQTMEEFEAELAKLQQQLPEVNAAVEDGRAESGKGKGEALGVVLTELQQRNRALLVADAKHLDSEAEIRRMFGSAAVKDKGRRIGAASLGKRLTLSHPKDNWPAMRAQAGVEMRAADSAVGQAEDPTGGSWFVMEHSGRFRSVQTEFLAAVMTHSADGVAAIAHNHPYHVDALLQLSEILKQTGGDFAEAGELVE
ncbi:Transcription factor 25, partial [Coemansia furcata]